jgi:hypothetical protein
MLLTTLKTMTSLGGSNAYFSDLEFCGFFLYSDSYFLLHAHISIILLSTVATSFFVRMKLSCLRTAWRAYRIFSFSRFVCRLRKRFF